jgi:hypothetical protein
MSRFWWGYFVGTAVSNRYFVKGLGLCVLGILAVTSAFQIAHAVATRGATDDRQPSTHLRNPEIAKGEVLQALSPYGDCEMALAMAIPPPADGRPVVDALQLQRRAVMAGKILRQYDTDADPYRRVEVRIDHSADGVTVAGTIHAAFTPTEAMEIQLRHGRQVYHKVQGWKCQKTSFTPAPAR